MYKLIRFFNQNRKKIIKITLFVVCILVLIQLLNLLSKNSNENQIIIDKEESISNNSEFISDKSSISGQTINSTKLQSDKSIIDEFMNFCNDQKVNSAYELLTEECKEQMFPNIEDFNRIYYLNVFNGETKNYTIENWFGSIYKVQIVGDILSTGNINNNQAIQDYITVVKKENEYKLNINSYIGRIDINKETENKNIQINVKYKDVYMDYEIYNFSVKNNSDNSILMDIGDDTKSVYLLDNRDIKYYFYSNEVIDEDLIIPSKYINHLQMKFMTSYSSNKSIKSMIFSKLILNYDEYRRYEDKNEYKDIYLYNVQL